MHRDLVHGLAKSFQYVDNDRSVISINDEFSNFVESLDNGSKKSNEKSRILTLYNGSNWSKKTKTAGSFQIDNPRFTIIGFTQPDYLIEFCCSPANVRDGFFQRFLVCIPNEVFIKRQQIKEAINNTNEGNMDMKGKLKKIYKWCGEDDLVIPLSKEAENVYDEYYDAIVDFRRAERHNNYKVSVKSKSRGLSLRLSGIICLLRNALGDTNDFVISKNDYLMALEIVRYSVDTAFVLMNDYVSPKGKEIGKKDPKKS